MLVVVCCRPLAGVACWHYACWHKLASSMQYACRPLAAAVDTTRRLSPPPVSRLLLEELLPPTAAAVVNSSAAEEEAPADETLPTSRLQPSARRSRRNLWQRRCGGSGVRRSPLITPVWATVGPCNLPCAHTRTSMGPSNLQ